MSLSDSDRTLLVVLIAFMLGVIWGTTWTYLGTESRWKREAAGMGHAEYVCDSVTGKTEWRWKESGDGLVKHKIVDFRQFAPKQGGKFE